MKILWKNLLTKTRIKKHTDGARIMNIVSGGDSNVFHCLKELAVSVRRFYGKPIIIYDIGLTAEQKKQLDAVVVTIPIAREVNCKGKAFLSPEGIPSTRATHKPFCVKHYFENHQEPMIMVDADCLFTQRVEETGFDVGVTYYRPKNPEQIYYYNGIINSGVIFFNSPATELVNRWAKECKNENTTDQKALSDVLSETINWDKYKQIQDWHGLKIKIFDARIYNDYHLTKKGKILHFITSKHQKDYYEKLIDGYKQGKDIRKMFREIKRGKKSHIKSIAEKLTMFLRESSK